MSTIDDPRRQPVQSGPATAHVTPPATNAATERAKEGTPLELLTPVEKLATELYCWSVHPLGAGSNQTEFHRVSRTAAEQLRQLERQLEQAKAEAHRESCRAKSLSDHNFRLSEQAHAAETTMGQMRIAEDRWLEERDSLRSQLQQQREQIANVWIVSWLNPVTLAQGVHGVFADEQYATREAATYNRTQESVYKVSQWLVTRAAIDAASQGTKKEEAL